MAEKIKKIVNIRLRPDQEERIKCDRGAKREGVRDALRRRDLFDGALVCFAIELLGFVWFLPIIGFTQVFHHLRSPRSGVRSARPAIAQLLSVLETREL